jgi:hypothetical protein
MIEVHLNGLRLIPGIDYTATHGEIKFTEAPCLGDNITISSTIPGSVGVQMQALMGNGHTFAYKIDRSFSDRVVIQNLLDDAWTYQNVPAVLDVLDQLKVVLALVKQDDPLHQRR